MPDLPGRQGRLLFASLVLNRTRLRNALDPSPGVQAVYQRLLALGGDDA